MEFIKLNTTITSTQKLRIFNSTKYDLDCTFELDQNNVIKELFIELVNTNNNDHEIKSAVVCKNTMDGNDKFNYLLINMQKGNHKSNITLKSGDSGYLSPVIFKKGDMIFVDSYEFDNNNHEIKKCSEIKIFRWSFDPQHKKGNIIVGNP
ncbi:MAG: hypothetical protein HRU26_14390 [Psychroserpens sp.]|nr:hypothetical protein [Psychroserpens sp.]